MRFVDQCEIRVVAGNGGNGVVAFRRERFIPFGGPSGGDGGKGGDVIFTAAEGLSSLQDVIYQRTIHAERGEHGQGSDCYGRAGADKVVRVPVGTQIFDATTDTLLVDLTENGQTFVAAAGGRGGRGNKHFATPHDRAPRRAEKGEEGVALELRLELKVMADVGLLGFPNVGKSTFVSTVSRATPLIADYPFTTLVPTLGVVEMFGGPRQGGTTFVVADLPGLIPGASEGVGLGIQFLKHVERTRVLLHLVTADFAEGREPLADYEAIRTELLSYNAELAQLPEVVALSKIDIPEVAAMYPALRQEFARRGVGLIRFSAATREGLDELLDVLFKHVRGMPVPPPPAPTAAQKKPSSKETAVEQTAPKKAAPKKTAPKKTAKKPAAKKPAKQPVAKKKPAAKKLLAKKTPAAKKPAAKKLVAPKKPAAKKPVAKKPVAKKAQAVKKKAPATKKAANKLVAKKKPAAKRASPHRPAAKKNAPKKRKVARR